jgi:hypothetical protein
MKVLCLIKHVRAEQTDQEAWMDILPERKINLLPLYDHPHTDVENGQHETHYHQDSRYNPIGHSFASFVGGRVQLPLKDGEYLGFRDLKKKSDVEVSATPVRFIKKSKLKHKCIHKGKCPHRGFDLKDTKAVDGVITCPLHSLRFNAETKKLIDEI